MSNESIPSSITGETCGCRYINQQTVEHFNVAHIRNQIQINSILKETRKCLLSVILYDPISIHVARHDKMGKTTTQLCYTVRSITVLVNNCSQ